jgi:hypothetical protein
MMTTFEFLQKEILYGLAERWTQEKKTAYLSKKRTSWMEENAATSSHQNTPCVPTQIMIDPGLTTDRASPNVYNLQRHYFIKKAAAHQPFTLANGTYMDQEFSEIPSIKLLFDNTSVKSFANDILDIIQNNNALRQGNEEINILEAREL